MDVSIIIITFNYENYILSCLESCLNQKNFNLEYEIILIDDGSQDCTQEVLKKISSKKLTKIEIKNSGIECASNIGFTQAKGKYIVRVDADDLLLPNYLEIMSKYINKSYDFFYSDYQVIDGLGFEKKKVKLPEFNKNEIFERGDFLATGTLYNSKVIKDNSYYNTSIKNSGIENYELILKLISRGYRGFRVPFNLFAYRRHSANISKLKKDNIIKNGKTLFFKSHYGKFKTNINHPYDLRI